MSDPTDNVVPDQDETPDFMKPVSLTLENTASATPPGKNPLLPDTGGGMAALDGNQPFAYYGNSAADDTMPNDSALDDLTVPKDQYSDAIDSASGPDATTGKPAGNNDGIDLLSDKTTASNPAPDQTPQSPAVTNTTATDVNTAADSSKQDAANDNFDDDIYQRALELSDKPEVIVGGRWIAQSDRPAADYIHDIYSALAEDKASRAARGPSPQDTDDSQDVFKNPGPIPGLGKGLQALVDTSYELAKSPTAYVNGSLTERSHYNDQDGYRRMILRDLLAEVHGGYDKIPDSEAPLVNPQFSPALAAFGRNVERITKLETGMLTGGATAAAEMPEAVKTALDWLSELYGD